MRLGNGGNGGNGGGVWDWEFLAQYVEGQTGQRLSRTQLQYRMRAFRESLGIFCATSWMVSKKWSLVFQCKKVLEEEKLVVPPESHDSYYHLKGIENHGQFDFSALYELLVQAASCEDVAQELALLGEFSIRRKLSPKLLFLRWATKIIPHILYKNVWDAITDKPPPALFIRLFKTPRGMAKRTEDLLLHSLSKRFPAPPSSPPSSVMSSDEWSVIFSEVRSRLVADGMPGHFPYPALESLQQQWEKSRYFRLARESQESWSAMMVVPDWSYIGRVTQPELPSGFIDYRNQIRNAEQPTGQPQGVDVNMGGDGRPRDASFAWPSEEERNEAFKIRRDHVNGVPESDEVEALNVPNRFAKHSTWIRERPAIEPLRNFNASVSPVVSDEQGDAELFDKNQESLLSLLFKTVDYYYQEEQGVYKEWWDSVANDLTNKSNGLQLPMRTSAIGSAIKARFSWVLDWRINGKPSSEAINVARAFRDAWIATGGPADYSKVNPYEIGLYALNKPKAEAHRNAKYKEVFPCWVHAIMTRNGFETKVHHILEARGIRIPYQTIRLSYAPLLFSVLKLGRLEAPELIDPREHKLRNGKNPRYIKEMIPKVADLVVEDGTRDIET